MKDFDMTIAGEPVLRQMFCACSSIKTVAVSISYRVEAVCLLTICQAWLRHQFQVVEGEEQEAFTWRMLPRGRCFRLTFFPWL